MSMNNHCIYCNASNPQWAKAHVVPRLMGTFKNQPTLLKKVCKDCDTVIGECEALLSKCTIEGVLLKHIGIVGRHKGTSSSPFRRGHSGHPPIKLTTAIPGYDQTARVEPIGDSHNVDLIPQLIITDKHGSREEIAINNPDCINISEWSILLTKCLQGHVKDLDIVGLSDEQYALISHVFRELGITHDPIENLTISPVVKQQALVKGASEFDDRYFRAIAKIAFHYFLLHTKVFDGYESEYNTIRRFIRYGEGDVSSFLTKHSQPIAHDTAGRDRPPYYGHVLRTDLDSNSISVCVQLFIGHDYLPDWYKVKLSQKQQVIFLQTEEFGHYYKYLELDERSQYDGDIEQVTVAQILKFPGVFR